MPPLRVGGAAQAALQSGVGAAQPLPAGGPRTGHCAEGHSFLHFRYSIALSPSAGITWFHCLHCRRRHRQLDVVQMG